MHGILHGAAADEKMCQGHDHHQQDADVGHIGNAVDDGSAHTTGSETQELVGTEEIETESDANGQCQADGQ